MIKYVELTAPEASAYRQAKIISFECNEGDSVKAGDTLFIVQSGNTKLELPSTKDGKIVEFIVTEQENITLSTPLLLLETVVSESTASPYIDAGSNEGLSQPTKPSRLIPGAESDDTRPSPSQGTSVGSKTEADSAKHQLPKADRTSNMPNPKQSKSVKRHEQQSLDLLAGLDTSQSKPPAPAISERVKSKSPQITLEQITERKPMSKSNVLTVSVPDIGADSAKVIEILVQVGDQVSAEDPLVTLESDKASMDVPSPSAGVVNSISVLMDQDVSEGVALIELGISNENSNDTTTSKPDAEPVSQVSEQANSSAANDNTTIVPIAIPDIGGDSAKVVEILVSVGDHVAVEDPLITLESDKASMEVPSSAEGVIQSIEVNVDEDVQEGTVVVILEAIAVGGADTTPAVTTASHPSASNVTSTSSVASPAVAAIQGDDTKGSVDGTSDGSASHASPSIRRFARELGVDLSRVSGTGRKSRVTKDDVKAFVKGVISQPSQPEKPTASGGAGIPPVPAQDFSKFGDIEVQPLNKIKRLTAENLHRSWLNVPHVTHNDESNINDLESFRKQLNAEYKAQKKDIKLSPLAFIVKAVVNALQLYPQFNSSLEPGGENLILKKYFHIGIAVETPNGLVVPVVRNADTKSVAQIAKEMGELAKKARDKKLTMNDMSGACFTISSLGGIGGTGFTPIVNAPEVAILGVSRSKVEPVWDGAEFKPGMILPLSLSYDHRVIDGAEAARFTRHIAAVLEDVRRLTV